jgi:hypothetical protein
MTEEEFWHSSPKQLIIKARLYTKFRNQGNDDPEQVQFGYIDEIF